MKGWCSNCRPGRHALCSSAHCECGEGTHRMRPPKPKAADPVAPPARPEALNAVNGKAAKAAAPVVPIVSAAPQPIGHWRAYNECFRHREDARWSFRSKFSSAEGRQPEPAQVDEGVVRCPLDESCRFSEVRAAQ